MKETTHVSACVNHIRSKAAQNTADISGHLGKHSGTERNSGNVFFLNRVTGAKCFFIQFQLQKIAEVEGVAIL